MDILVTSLICIIIAAICVYAVVSYRKKIKNGCCGGDCCCESNKTCSDKTDYNYKITVYIDGMTCQHCKSRVESLLGGDGMKAEVDLAKKCAYVWSTHPIDEAEIKEIIINNGYGFVSISSEN